MPDFSHIFSTMAVVGGFVAGLIFTIVLLTLGHGWASLLALPITIFALWLPAYILEGH